MSEPEERTVPGVWVCDACDLVLYQRYFNSEGSVGIRLIDVVPDCLNGCQPMRPQMASEAEDEA